MKRYLSFLLCMAMLLCLLPAMSAAADDLQVISGVRLTLPGDLFDGSGKLLPAGSVTDLNPVSETPDVLAESVTWFCNGVPVEIPDSALQSFASYRVFVRLQAEGEHCFTADTQVEILDTIQPLQGISPDGKAAYVLSPSIMTACNHSPAELQSDVSGHWMECPHCYHSFDLSDHLWDDGEASDEEILYTCTVCGTDKTEAPGKQLLHKASLHTAPPVLNESIPEPTLENDDEFRIVRYQWFKGGTRDEHKINAGDTFSEGKYYLSITVRIKNPGQDYIGSNSYISTAGAWKETSCTVDADAGAITSIFSIPVYPTTTANVTLPTVRAGADIADALKACQVTSPKVSPSLTSVMVYENGEYVGLYAETSLGFSTWIGEDAAFQPGKVYTLIGTASFDGCYTDSAHIFVENPDICEALNTEGGAEALGFRATYLCPKEYDITSVVVSGVKNPVADTVPAEIKLDCEAPTLYDAKISAWYDNEKEVSIFEEGRTYQAIIAVTPKQNVDGLNQDSAPLLPVIVNGQLAEFVAAGDHGSFLYRADFLCDPNPNPHSHAYVEVITAPTCEEGGYTTYTCECGDSYRDGETAALGHAWDEGRTTIPPTEYEEGEMTYTCTRCDETQTKELPKLDHKHSYQSVVTDPTCEEGGYTTYSCECGDSYIADETEALGCDYEVVVVEPTCTEQGFSTQRCRRCGITIPIMEDFVDALGHDYVNGVCTRCGAKDAKYHDCPAKNFSDMPAENHWAHKGIDYAVTNKLMNGIGSNKFNPSGTLTRAELVTILYRVEGTPKAEYKGTFKDVAEGQWYTDAIEWAAANEIVNGVGDGTNFDPSGLISREQIATILYRYSNSPTVEGDLTAFPDHTTISSYAATAMIWANQKGIINGTSSNGVALLAPKASATREQIASIMMRYLTDE